MPIFRVPKNHNFTIMSNYHLKDKELSLKAKGLLSYMLSLPDDWDFSLNGLVAKNKESIRAIRTTIDELKEHNYLTVRKFRNDKGYFEYEYIIYEKPIQDTEKNAHPDIRFVHMDNPHMDTVTQLNTKIINTNKKKVKRKKIATMDNDLSDDINLYEN